jgi:bacillopeptidase F
MVRSRLRNYQDKKERRQIMLILMSMVGIFIFLAIFGVKLLVAFSLGIDKLRGSSPKDQQVSQTIILPPILDPLPEATNSAEIKVSGRAKGDVSILLYVNEKQTDKVKIQSDGTFQFPNVAVKEGTNVISAKAEDDKNNSSDLSEVLSITVIKNKPTLDIASPSDNAVITGEKQMTTVSGKTGSDDTITINDRFVVVNSDGSFSYEFPLKEGEQTITITSKDQAGNETKVERKVTFKK